MAAVRAIAAALATALVVSGCGGSAGGHSAMPKSAAIVLMATPPDSLDPAVGSTPEALEADSLAYTPLLTYAHATGVSGTRVIAGLAEHLPTITDGGTTYTLTLRPGLKYSNGQPVRAGDFIWSLERAIRLWRGPREEITRRIVGASAFAAGRARTISGIATDDATGQIRIRLTAPDGGFENVLALPALAPVPAGTPLTDQQTPLPPGLGPYRIVKLLPGKSFSLIRNPGWQRLGVQYVPPGRLDIDVRITGDPARDALSVLHNTADVFDFSDRIAPSLLGQIKRQASRRYFSRAMRGTYVIFLNVTRKPFSSRLAREAVLAALDQNTIALLDSGMLLKGCYLLPPSLYGHPHDPCPDGNGSDGGDLALAKALVRRSGTAGTPVVVWSESSSPIRQWMAYYTSLLTRLGFEASLKPVPDAAYYRTVGEQRLHPQTGFGELDGTLPNPADIYRRLTDQAIRRTGNENWGEVDDPHVNATVRSLAAVPASTLSAVDNLWRELELYVAGKGYLAVVGYPTFPVFVSSRIDTGSLVFAPVVGYDWSSLRLK